MFGLIRLVLLASLMSAATLTSAQNLVQNPSFETPNQAGWASVVNVMSTADWLDSAAVPPRTDGAVGLTSRQNGATSQILYQDIVLPASGIYLLQLDVGCNPSGGGAEDFCRVDITQATPETIVAPSPLIDSLATTAGGVLRAVYGRDGLSGAQAQAPVSVQFAGSIGQPVRLRIVAQGAHNNAAVLVDNIRLTLASSAERVPVLTPAGVVLMVALISLIGVLGFARAR